MNASTNSLTDDLFSQLLQGGAPQQIADQLGADADQTRDAIGAALPMLLGALGRNAQEPQGAADLFGALQRDHAAGPDRAGCSARCWAARQAAACLPASRTAAASSATSSAAPSRAPKAAWARRPAWAPARPASC